MDWTERLVGHDSPKTRFGALFLTSGVATVLLMPIWGQGIAGTGGALRTTSLVIALIPALIAWLAVRKRPARQGPALLRGVSLILALVGAGALGLLGADGKANAWITAMTETRGFASKAAVYLAIGLFGLAASFLFGGKNDAGITD
jgi:hypothetical protein